MKTESLSRDVAQMVMPRLDGEKLDDGRYFQHIQELIRKGIGGFILFGGTVERTPEQLQGLQNLSEVPLLIASDIERGLGQQLVGGTRFPSQRAVASAINRRSRKDVDLLNRMLDAVRIETRAAGIHAVFSPVLDVNNNADNPIICTRAFGDEPKVVEWFGSQYIKRLQKSSGRGSVELLACAKHFPGHGDTNQDSHSILPIIKADRQRLNRIELPPFREAVKDGVSMVMIAHLLVLALDPEKPATFSKKTVTALLREGMDFNGLIVSDALDMGALAAAYPQGEIAVRTVEAGMDILLHPTDPEATIAAVVSAVEEGKLTRERIMESVDRIRAAKISLGLFDKTRHVPIQIDYHKHRVIAGEIGRKALRIVSGNKKQLHLGKNAGIACFILDDDDNTESGNAFIHAVRDRFRHVSFLILTPTAETPESLVLDSIKAADITILAFFSRISASKGHSGVTDKLREKATRILNANREIGGKSVIVSFDSPYILEQFGDGDVQIAAYDRMKEIQHAVADLFIGNKSES
jgi:beta-N-acetylhexosaminidase